MSGGGSNGLSSDPNYNGLGSNPNRPGGPNGPKADAGYVPYTVDPAQLSAFTQSESGKKYANDLSPTNTYNQNTSNNGIILGAPGSAGSREVTQAFAAYNAWLSGNAQTQTNWNAYSAAVAANQGGEGDNTITTGMAVSQRNRLLGSLANAGNPTAPTPGLGSMGGLK